MAIERLIDANALKERFSNMYRDDYEEWIKSIIDKAPTVPDRYDEGYNVGFDDGYAVGYIAGFGDGRDKAKCIEEDI